MAPDQTYARGDRVLLVTGGSRGIGAATARRAARAGWGVALGFVRDRDAAQRVVDEISGDGGWAMAVQADVAEEADVKRLFATVEGRMARPLGLVNSAGIVAERRRLDGMASVRMHRMLMVNALGTMLCCREAVSRMSTRNGGSGGAIVNVGSAASRTGSPGEYVDYAASKGAVDAFTLGLAREVADEGVRVSCVRPGIVDTDIHASGGQPDKAKEAAARIPMGRAGHPEEVAEAIVWLLSDEASYTTGAILDVAGGR